MQLIDLLIIGLALAVGFFGVTYNGMKLVKSISSKILIIPIVFSLISSIFLCLGYFLGIWLKSYFPNYEYQLVFFILAGVGVKVFLEGTGKKKGHTVYILEDMKIVVSAALIYSLNYFIVGLCLFLFLGGFLEVIGVFLTITIVISFVGLFLGRAIKYHISDFTMITSGIVLIAMAAKILMTHIGYI